MAGRFKLAILLLSSALALSSCMTTTSIEGEKIDLSSIQEAAKRGKISEILGEPLEKKDFGSYRIAAHEWDRGRTELLLVWPGVPVAFVQEYSFLTLAYQTDGSFLELKIWDRVESGRRRAPNEVIRLHRDLLVEREAHDQEARAMELARLGPICEISFADALGLNEKEIIDRFGRCSKGNFLSLRNRMMWGCLAANHNSVGAQNWMGRQYEEKYHASGLTSDLLESYKWYTLANPSGYVGPGYRHCYHKPDVGFTCDAEDRLTEVRSKLTIEAVAEVEQLISQWQPDPSECEALSQAVEGSIQDD